MIFKNENLFRSWLKENLKSEFAKLVEYDNVFQEWLCAVENSFNNGNCSIEIPYFMSIDKTPKEYYFVVKDVNDTGENDLVVIF